MEPTRKLTPTNTEPIISPSGKWLEFNRWPPARFSPDSGAESIAVGENHHHIPIKMGEFDQNPSFPSLPLSDDRVDRVGSERALSSQVNPTGRYNQFQRTMLQWSSLHPYNAVHVVQIGRLIDPVHFGERLNHVLTLCGLGNLTIDSKGGFFRFHGGNPECIPKFLDGGSDPIAALYHEMECQLNDVFQFDRPFTPFRFFLLSTGGESFVGISYFHAVADAESITRLLVEIVRASFDDSPQPIRDNTLRPSGEGRLPTEGPLAAVRRSWSALARIQAMRSSFRPPRCEITDLRNEFSGVSLNCEETAELLATAREWGLTINDLCLASLLLALAPVTPGRFLESRPRLSVGCVVNLRNDLAPKKRNYFGLFLGSFAVSHEVEGEVSLRELANSVRAQTLAIKKRKLYLAASLEFMISRFLFGRTSREKQCNFYRKSYPLWGSITNMKMDELCSNLDVAPIRDYYRAVSAGPAMPLVIAVTGVAGHLNFGASYRPTTLPATEVEGIMDRFISQLKKAGGKA